jgi:hypothetical protein
MSATDSNPTPASPRPARAGRKSGPPVSAIAVASTACAVIVCCPLMSVLAVMLGVTALRKIRLSGGRLGGRRLAVTGTMIGAASLLIQMVLLSRWSGLQRNLIEQQATRGLLASIEAAQTGDAPAAMAPWSPAATLRPEATQLLQFGGIAEQRYGRIRRVGITNLLVVGSWWQPEFEFAVHYAFERAELAGSAKFDSRMAGFVPELQLLELTIEDRAAGDLRLPAQAGPSLNPTTPTTAASSPAGGA